ncbi:hypothetical protein ABPG73_018758 [Tetrahymena malaccensis]
MLQNQLINYENSTSFQFKKPLQDEFKSFENSLSFSNSTTKNPFIKVKQVSVVDILKGDDLDSIQSQCRITQNNLHKFSENNINEQNHDLDSSLSQESFKCKQIIEEKEGCLNSHEIQVDWSCYDSQLKGKQSENEVKRLSFTQIIGQLVKKKRKNNIELEYINSKDIWKKKWLGVLFYVSKFLYLAKQCQKVFRASLLTSFQLHLIGDASSDFEQNETFSKNDLRQIVTYKKFNKCISQKTLKNFKKRVRKYISCIQNFLIWFSLTYQKIIKKFLSALPLISSQSPLYIFWETITFFCSFINFIYLPFEISFNIQRSLLFSYYLQVFCPILYSLDILIKSNTQNFQQGNHIQQHKQILKEYIRSSFILDLVSLISLNQNIFKFKGLQLLFFVRIFRSLKIIDIIREYYFSNTFYSGIISLLLLFAGSLFYGHLFACVWYYVGNQSEQGWIDFNQLDRSDIYSNYICSYYYAVVTMTTIGYGDITAKTTEERFLMIFLALLSCGIFGFTINSIGNILSDFKQKSDTYLTELGKLNKYLSFYQVSSQVQTNARKHLKFVHQEKNKDQLSTFQSLNNLSQDLQNQIKMEVVSKKLKQLKFIRNIFKEETIFQLSLQVKESIFQPEQIILGQNEVKEPAIYIINFGRVQKYSQYDLTAKEHAIIELKEKENFGFIEFFMNQEKSNFNYKSKELTSIFSLQLSSFLKIIQQDNESYEKFCYIRDQVIYQQYLSQVSCSCLSCQSKNHTLNECPSIFYDKRYVSIVKKYLQQDQEQNYKKRKAKNKQNCWKLFDKNQSQAIDFQNDNINQLSFNECSQLTEEDGDDKDELINNSKDFCFKELEAIEAEPRKSIFTQNLLKISEDRENLYSFKTGEVLNEDDCSIINIGSELKPQIMIQPRKHNMYDIQKSEEIKKQSSHLIEQQQEDDLFRQSLNSQKNICYLNQSSLNVAQNQNLNTIQCLIQNLKDFQIFLLQNQTTLKAPFRQGNLNKLNTKRIDSSSMILNLKKEFSSSLNGSSRNVKYAKEYSQTFQEIKIQKKKSQSEMQFNEENIDKLHQFKIYYPQNNYDINLQELNKSAENSQSSFSSVKKNPFIKVRQVSVVDILKGDDQESFQSQTKITQNNIQQFSQNVIHAQNQVYNSQNSQESYQCSKIIEEEYSMTNKTDGMDIQVDYSCDESHQKATETQNDQMGNRQSFTQIIGQLVKKKRKNNIELENINSKNVWKKKWLGVLFYVSKFLYQAKQTQMLFRAALLTSFQLHLIGDTASDFEQNDNFSKLDLRKMLSYSKFNKCVSYKTYKNFKKKVRKYFKCFQSLLIWISLNYFKLIRKIFSAIPLINSQSTFYIIWETVIFFCSFINFIYLPFELSFGKERNLLFSVHISIICPIIYSLDILIKSNTQTFQQGSHIQQHQQILKDYLTSSFILDIISLVSLNEYIFKFKGSQLLFFVRIFKSLRIIDIIREYYFSNTFYSGIISLFLLFAGSLFYGHLFACLWYYVGTQNDQGWINYNQLDRDEIYSNYICSYYYAVVTMTTIGYGDITAKTTEERSVMIFLALLSCGIFGFTINSIGNILSDFKQKSDMYLTELGKLNKFLSHYQVSTQVQTNARKYLKFVHQEKNKDQLSTLQSLNNLSDYLQNQIKMEVISKKLKQIHFFRNILKEETILKLSLQVKESIYQPEQIILGQNEVKEPAIYIINHGKVLKYSQYDLVARENSIVELKEKENFGLIEFFTNKENSNFNFKSKELTSIFSLQLSSFLKIIQQDNETYEKFCYIRDQVIYQQYLSQVNYSCLSCQSKNHTLKECPCIFYSSRKVNIVKQNLTLEKEISTIKRSTKKKQNCWRLFELNNSKALDFQNDNIHQFSQNECSQTTEEEQNDENGFYIQEQETPELDPNKILFNQNLLKINEERENFVQHKTSEVINEDDCSIGRIGSELKPQIMIQSRRNQPYDQQKSDEIRRQNSNLIDHQLDEEIARQGQVVTLNSQKNIPQPIHSSINIPQTIHSSMNIPQNQSQYLIQSLIQNLKEIQLLLSQNISPQKVHQKQGNISRLNTKRMESCSIFNFKKEQSSSLIGSNNNVKYAKSISHTLIPTQTKQQKSIVEFEFQEEEFDKLHQFKIYYPLSNYDVVISNVNKSQLQFKIPQMLKYLKLKKSSQNQSKIII